MGVVVGATVVQAAGCASHATESGEWNVAAGALVGTSAIRWVETYADLRGLSGQGVHEDDTAVVVVLGRIARGDGGGGIFFWVDGSAAPADDDGTVLHPLPSVVVPDGPGYWQRLFEGPLNVKWFGAIGNGNTVADGAAIQQAIDVAAATGHGVFLPAGVYRTDQTLIIPCSTQRPFVMRGVGPGREGVGGTIIAAQENDLDTDQRLVEFAPNESAAEFYVFENLTLQSESGGHVFFHEAAHPDNTRLKYATIRNCRFVCGPRKPGAVALYIKGGWNTLIENVVTYGAEWGVRREGSTRCTVRNLSTGMKGHSWNPHILGGGGHTLEQIRLEGLAPPAGVTTSIGIALENCGEITMSCLDFESHLESRRISIENSHSITMTRVGLGAAATDAYVQYGLYMSDSSNIRGTSINSYDFYRVANPNCRAIRVESSVKHLRLDSLAFYKSVGERSVLFEAA